MTFTRTKVEEIAYKAAYICCNPNCNTLTVGPSVSGMSTKIGEAAHIYGDKSGSARFEKNPNINKDSVQNGIWLCASCHTLIDKNQGADYSAQELLKWKEDHEQTIMMFINSHKSALPLLYKSSKNLEIAQYIVDQISSRGVYFQDESFEDKKHAIKSIEQVRKIITKAMKEIESDSKLKDICNKIQNSNREFMNKLSRDKFAHDNTYFNSLLYILRQEIGNQLKKLRDDLGCNVSGQITIIIK